MKAEFSYEGILQSNRNLPSCINENKLASKAFSTHIRTYEEMKVFPPPPIKKIRKSKISMYSLNLLDGNLGIFFVSKNLVAFSYTEVYSDKYDIKVRLKIAFSYFDNDGTNLINPFYVVANLSGFLFDPDIITDHLKSQLKKASSRANSIVKQVSKIAKTFPVKSKKDCYELKSKVDSILKHISSMVYSG